MEIIKPYLSVCWHFYSIAWGLAPTVDHAQSWLGVGDRVGFESPGSENRREIFGVEEGDWPGGRRSGKRENFG